MKNNFLLIFIAVFFPDAIFIVLFKAVIFQTNDFFFFFALFCYSFINSANKRKL